MRQRWIGTGWKMNKTLGEAEAYARSLRDFVQRTPVSLQLFVVPPFTALDRVCQTLGSTPIKVGAQNMHWQERGAFTGEISPLMLKDCGVHLVELGHSERRAAFGETDFTLNAKVQAALQHDLVPLICVGETASEKEYGAARETVTRQVKIALHGVTASAARRVILAYEPVWAIGDNGIPSEPGYANAMHRAIRQACADLWEDAVARDIPILYGGSVNAENAVPFVQQDEVDGLFIGRAAWDVGSFIRIIQLVDAAIGEKK